MRQPRDIAPYAILAVAARLYGYGRQRDAAAGEVDASPLRVRWHVTPPLKMPGVLAAARIVSALFPNAFGVTFLITAAQETPALYVWSHV